MQSSLQSGWHEEAEEICGARVTIVCRRLGNGSHANARLLAHDRVWPGACRPGKQSPVVLVPARPAARTSLGQLPQLVDVFRQRRPKEIGYGSGFSEQSHWVASLRSLIYLFKAAFGCITTGNEMVILPRATLAFNHSKRLKPPSVGSTTSTLFLLLRLFLPRRGIRYVRAFSKIKYSRNFFQAVATSPGLFSLTSSNEIMKKAVVCSCALFMP